MGWRQFVDDARRIQFVIALVLAFGAAVGAGTYWGWWAYMWDVALPFRVVGVLAVSATVFVTWYGLLFSSYYYFGIPKRNPLVGPRMESDIEHPNLQLSMHGGWDGDVYSIDVTNEGDTDSFAVAITWMHGAIEYPTLPAMVRWRGVDAEKREIVKGHTQRLDVCHFKRAATGTASRPLSHLWLLAPATEHDLLRGACTYLNPYVVLKVTSVTTGKSDKFGLHLTVVSDAYIRTSSVLVREDQSVYSFDKP